ncbi:MAG: hypothetical protein OSB43_04575 [Nocardioides sp.]|uniref:hypothetical protein n=1 Tax=Nocardioides sp. TaxID=35761 RepID=UPI0023A03767|nr:hypothetical protein [Nocardioides sp.]MDE0775533.1 hypothetical protein [Nocardioides sp.]
MTPSDSPDYAEPAVLGSSRAARRDTRPDVRLWGGRGRRVLQWACAAGALLLPAALVVVLLSDRPGAASPEAAVEQLLGGIADLDGAAIVGVVAPDEVADVARADDAYSRLASRVVREGEVPPVEVDRVLAAAEGSSVAPPDVPPWRSSRRSTWSSAGSTSPSRRSMTPRCGSTCSPARSRSTSTPTGCRARR